MPEKISSLHDDLEMPFSEKKKPEYGPEKDSDRFPDVGKKGEKSVINRIAQFGVTEEDLLALGIENPTKISESQYKILLKEAIKEQYDTIFASVFKYWSEIETPQEQKKIIKKVSEMYRAWGLNLILKGGQISEKEPNLVISLEGADFVRNLGDIEEIYNSGIRSVNVQCGEENALADNEGLTELGRQSISKMLDLGMVIDLAHANPNVRRDIFALAEDLDKGKLIAYTHGASIKDIAEGGYSRGYAQMRGLSEKEMKKIIKLGGIIGLGVTRPFFGSIEKIAERIDKIFQIEHGENSLGLGTDFGGVPPSWCIGINKPEDIAKIGDVLATRFGYSDSSIRNILRQNIHQWVSRVIGKKE